MANANEKYQMQSCDARKNSSSEAYLNATPSIISQDKDFVISENKVDMNRDDDDVGGSNLKERADNLKYDIDIGDFLGTFQQTASDKTNNNNKKQNKSNTKSKRDN